MAHPCPNCGEPMDFDIDDIGGGYYCTPCKEKRIRESEMAALRKYAKKYGYRLVKKSNTSKGGE